MTATPPTRPGLRDVARLAGVSHQTVSRVFKNHPMVSPKTRDRVLAAAAQQDEGAEGEQGGGDQLDRRVRQQAQEAAGADGQGALGDALFRAYFTDGANVADHQTLARLAAAAGLDPEAALGVLASDAHAREVAADQQGARERGVTGVPAFVIEDTWLIPGAQDLETMVATLTRAHTRLQQAAGQASAGQDGAGQEAAGRSGSAR